MVVEGRFDIVRYRLTQAIGDLGDRQSFHVVFFGAPTPIEFAPRKLVLATQETKASAADFIEHQVAEGTTVALPALARAIEVLEIDEKDKRTIVYLVKAWDFEWPGEVQNRYEDHTGNEAVVAFLREKNRATGAALDGKPPETRLATVHTILIGWGHPRAINVLKQIAAENGGEFRHVQFNE